MFKVFFVGALCLIGVTLNSVMADSKSLTVAMLIPGSIDDGGFMEAGFNGLTAISETLGAQTSYIADVESDVDSLAGALRRLADSGPDLIIAHGGQSAKAARRVAAEYPQVRFVVTQGDVIAENLSSYEVLQEESAWLAGAAAGLLTETNVVGHISGIKVTPGLKGRGAFYNGLMHTNPEAQFLTTFAGDQDDRELAHDVASATIDAGADIIFTMLNSGRDGATAAMREHGVKQMGNVGDWVTVDPEVFVGSAIADVSVAVLAAASDLANGSWKGNQIVQIGLDDVNAVGLTLGTEVPDAIRAELAGLRDAIVEGEIEVSVSYEGEEFDAVLTQ